MTVLITIIATLATLMLIAVLREALDNKRFSRELDAQITRFEKMLDALDPTTVKQITK